MAQAVFDVAWDFGGTDNSPGTEATAITNLRFNAEDTNDQDLASPLIIPSSPGLVYSYWKQLYLECTTAPVTQVNAVELYSDGTLGWGTEVLVNVGNEMPVHKAADTTGYDVANAQETMTNHTDVSAVTSLFTFTNGSAKSITIGEAGSIINAQFETTHYVVFQCTIDDDATPGTKSTELITWQYDEI